MPKCPKCRAEVWAYRDGFGKLIILDTRIKVYGLVRFKRDEGTDIIQATRTTMSVAEHEPLCRGGVKR